MIIDKAIEYITYLENESVSLSNECQNLKDQVEAFEILLMPQNNAVCGNPAQGVRYRYPQETIFDGELELDSYLI